MIKTLMEAVVLYNSRHKEPAAFVYVSYDLLPIVVAAACIEPLAGKNITMDNIFVPMGIRLNSAILMPVLNARNFCCIAGNDGLEEIDVNAFKTIH